METAFERAVTAAIGDELHAVEIDTIQANLGLRCDLACAHCHLDASPDRVESMEWPVMAQLVEAAQNSGCRQVELTGAAPELHPDFRRLVAALREAEVGVELRTNFTALLAEGNEDLPEFLRDQGVRVVGSLPCYMEENVDAQRGEGVFALSMQAMRRLNELGYGRGIDLSLDLVHNPVGAFLPPRQEVLEADYRLELDRRYGVSFNRLFVMNNSAMGRFLTALREQGREGVYQRLLEESFNPATLDGLMCRHLVAVRWDGTIFDCDFNLALGLPVHHAVPNRLEEFEPLELAGRKIMLGEHCFGCAAGHGSGCTGALSATTAGERM